VELVFTSHREAAEHLVELHGNRAAGVVAGVFDMAAPKGAEMLWEKLTKPVNE